MVPLLARVPLALRPVALLREHLQPELTLKRLALFTQGEFRDIAHPDGYHNLVEYAYAVTNTQHRSRSEGENIKIIPNTFKEAMGLPQAQQWKDVSQKEMKSLQDLNVYTLVPRSDFPPGKQVIGTKWVYKVKPDNAFKARLVAQGCNQVSGKDCGSTFSPVCRLQSIRMVLAITAEQDWEVNRAKRENCFPLPGHRGGCVCRDGTWLKDHGQ